MPYYETVFIARQDISATQVDSLADTFTKTIEDRGGQIAKREVWGLRPLAYRMKKQRKAHYVLFNIDAPAPAVHEMERQMRLNEDILRHLTIRVDALEEGPSAMMQMRSGRGDDRPRRDDRLRSSPRPAESEDDAPLASDSPDGDAADDADDDAAPDEEGDER